MIAKLGLYNPKKKKNMLLLPRFLVMEGLKSLTLTINHILPFYQAPCAAPKKEILVQPGVQEIIYYTAKNLSNKPTTGTAVYNVSPPKAGSVFMKVDCFCFIEQTLQPGEEVKMPVSFYVDPSISADENTKNLKEITLSYTFFSADT